MSIEIPPEFAAYMEARGCGVFVDQWHGYEAEDGEWIDGGEDLCIRKEKLVRDQLYMQVLTVPDPTPNPEVWGTLVELLEAGLLATIRRGEAWRS